MFKRYRNLTLLGLLYSLTTVADDRVLPVFDTGPSVLLLPSTEIIERIGGSIEPLSEYISSLSEACASEVVALPRAKGASGVLLVAIRPQLRSKIWVEFGENETPPNLAVNLRQKLESVPPPMVKEGAVAFMLNIELWGGGKPLTTSAKPVYLPPSWHQDIDTIRSSSEFESAINAAWPDEG